MSTTKSKKQTCTLPADDYVNNAQQPSNKETVSTFNLVGLKNRKLRDVITVRCYMGRSPQSSVVYACVWVHDHDRNLYFSGRGKASGGGYHKESAAIAEAIESAGITLSNDIAGRGDSAVHEALEAIAKKLGYQKTIIVTN